MPAEGHLIGSAVIGVVLARTTTTLGGYTLASEQGFRTGLLIGRGVALVSAAVAVLIPAVRAGSSDSATEETVPHKAATGA